MNESTNILNLENLIDLSSILLFSNDEKYIFNTLLLSLMGKFAIARGIIFYQLNSKEDNYIIASQKGKIILIDNKYHFTLNNISDFMSNPTNNFQYKFEFITESNKKIIILLSPKLNKMELIQSEYKYIQLVSKIVIAALKYADNYQKLKLAKQDLNKRNQILNTLFEINQDYSLVSSIDEIIRIFSHILMGQLMVSKLALYSTDDKNNYICYINRFKNSLSLDLLNTFNKINISTIIKASDFSEKSKNEINSNSIELIIPLYNNKLKKGFILLGNKLNNQEYTSENINFLESLASATIAKIDNQILISELIEKKNIERELNLALEIQQNLFPKRQLNYKSYSLFGKSIPSQQVGGDYFDYILLKNSNIIFTIADVSGKGLASSLLMANVQAAFRALTITDPSLFELMNSINKIVYDNTSPDKFVTMFTGLINTETNVLTYINAGHNPPILFKSNNEIIELKEGGLFLGMFDTTINYSIGEINIDHNDLICLYTDGISEAPNEFEQEFGIEKIIKNIQLSAGLDIIKIQDSLINEVNKFSFNTDLYDDQTLLILKRNN